MSFILVELCRQYNITSDTTTRVQRMVGASKGRLIRAVLSEGQLTQRRTDYQTRLLYTIELPSVKLVEGKITRFPHPPHDHHTVRHSTARSKFTVSDSTKGLYNVLLCELEIEVWLLPDGLDCTIKKSDKFLAICQNGDSIYRVVARNTHNIRRYLIYSAHALVIDCHDQRRSISSLTRSIRPLVRP
ncbi:hypothetical protein J6590_088533 [Homalodisca vitripennis]|nr:hypothetical protein J6590_088533 [Homalodisca vitripennis]